MSEIEPKVELRFRAHGRQIPVDHGYALYGGLCREMPSLHEDETAGVKLIRGRYTGNGKLRIAPHSWLFLRLPKGKIAPFLALAGKTLDIDGDEIRLGVPETRQLVPAVSLYAHIVTTRNGHDQSRFVAEIQNQMQKMNIRGEFSVGRRKTFGIHGKQVVGYEVTVFGLTAPESIAIQENGLGGRRKMGCGYFEAGRR